MERLEALREIALSHSVTMEEFQYRFHKYYSENTSHSQYSRYADAMYHAYTSLTPSIAAGELIVGTYKDAMTEGEKQEWLGSIRKTYIDRAEKAGSGQDSHMAIDYELILSLGLGGISDKIDTLIKNANDSQREFYLACKKCLKAVCNYSQNYAKTAEKLSRKEENPIRKKELQTIADICRKVPQKPAESFHEAVQSVHFVTHALSINPLRLTYQQFQLGHPDRYLFPYYKKDIESGKLTKEYAQLLLDCLGIQINMRVPYGLSSGYMVGGLDENLNPVQNELTYMCLKVIEDIRLVYPSVGLCYTESTPDSLMDYACRLLAGGHSHPAIFNDDTISRGLMYYGVPESEAHNYIHSTCVEITPTAASNVWVASPYTNMVALLMEVTDKNAQSFEDIVSSLLSKITEVIAFNYKDKKNARQIRCENSMNPLLSCFVKDCLYRGKDIERGGAKYNWIMPSFVGMANLTDCLYAIKKAVFEDKIITLPKLLGILKDDFEGNEALRQYLLTKIPKYGNDIDDIDSLYNLIAEHIASECMKYTDESVRLVPSVFCWEKHELFGRETGATPDGRKAGFPLGDGSGPCQGREFQGPTASILSSTKWNHYKFIGGVAVNMKFAKSTLGKNSINTMKSLIKTYLSRGGFEMQINVTDKKILEDAVKNPENYRDLIVRIGGYSNYFTRLSPNMQREVILRTEHEI